LPTDGDSDEHVTYGNEELDTAWTHGKVHAGMNVNWQKGDDPQQNQNAVQEDVKMDNQNQVNLRGSQSELKNGNPEDPSWDPENPWAGYGDPDGGADEKSKHDSVITINAKSNDKKKPEKSDSDHTKILVIAGGAVGVAMAMLLLAKIRTSVYAAKHGTVSGRHPASTSGASCARGLGNASASQKIPPPSQAKSTRQEGSPPTLSLSLPPPNPPSQAKSTRREGSPPILSLLPPPHPPPPPPRPRLKRYPRLKR
jgi:hypothetical protein